MKSKLTKKLLLCICFSFALLFAFEMHTEASTGKKIVTTYKSKKIAKKNAKGQYVFINQKDDAINRRALNLLLDNNCKKTIVIPSGQTVEIDALLSIGSNTTIIATGATIVQTTDGKGCIRNSPDSSASTIKYNLIKNVVIKGGKWKNKKNTKVHSLFRFAHGTNITVKGATIATNYKSHGIELIACKDVTIYKCKVAAITDSTKSSSSVEEAIQIDMATKTTAPGVYNEAKEFTKNPEKYIKGQCCRDITIKDCVVRGSRGICANICMKENGKWYNKLHTNIKITGCTVCGTSSEGVMLFNVKTCTLAYNTIKSKSPRGSLSYSDGLHLVNFANSSTLKNGTIKIVSNKIAGNYNGLGLYSRTSSKYGKTYIKKNTVYCKQGKSKAISVPSRYTAALSISGNTCKNW